MGILLVVSGATAVGGQTDPFAFTLVGEGQYCLHSGDRRETALALAAYLQQDLAKMRDELRRACDLGHSESCDELKMMVPSH